jgi:hypothetical protein
VTINMQTGLKKKWNVGRGSFSESTRNTDRERDFLKRKHGINELEAKLGSSATKQSYDLNQFRSGYFSAWVETQDKLFQFYRQKSLRHLQLNNTINHQRHNDRLTTMLLNMVGARSKNDPENKKKLVVIGQPTYSPRKNTAPSRATTFWEHFCRKVDVNASFPHISVWFPML